LTGIRTVDKSLLEMAYAFGAREQQLFWKIMLPGALPLTMAGLRIGMGRAVKGMINGEMFIALIGLGVGALVKTYGSRFDIEKVLGIMIIIIAVAIVTNSLMQALDRRLTQWVD
jgi:NitT/TauT family transport system permease protein